MSRVLHSVPRESIGIFSFSSFFLGFVTQANDWPSKQMFGMPNKLLVVQTNVWYTKQAIG
jgi:hypothetical protein